MIHTTAQRGAAFYKHIAKQVEQHRLEWEDTQSIRETATVFFKHSDLRCSPPRHSTTFTASSTNEGQSVNNTPNKACKPWNYTGQCECKKGDDDYQINHKCRVCKADHPMLHCAKRKAAIPTSNWLPAAEKHNKVNPQTTRNGQGHDPDNDFNIASIVRHIMASRSSLPNAFGAQIPVPSQLNVSQSEKLLGDYTDNVVATS